MSQEKPPTTFDLGLALKINLPKIQPAVKKNSAEKPLKSRAKF
jgi:hypothetical protein